MLTTVNAVAAARAAARDSSRRKRCRPRPATSSPMAGIVAWLELNGFNRASTVREPGEYAVRGGILDLFPPGMDEPVRLDFFGDTLESIRTFDPETQRTHGRAARARPGADGGIPAHHRDHPPLPHRLCRGLRRRRARRHALRGGERRPPPSRHGALAAAVPRAAGHAVRLSRTARRSRIEPLAEDAAHERLAQIADYYQARSEALEQAGGGAPYKPLPPDRLYLAEANGASGSIDAALARLTPFAAPEGSADVIDVGARAGHNFAAERSEPNVNVFEAVKTHVEALQAAGKRVVDRAVERRLARPHGARARRPRLAQSRQRRVLAAGAGAAAPRRSALAVLGIEAGFETADVAVITEQDILGDRLVRPRRPVASARRISSPR